jgi:putative ABC transport system permease protein
MSDNNHPPKWVLSFFRWFCHPDYQEDLEGDLLERFEKRLSERGAKHAKFRLVEDVLRLFRPGLMRSFIETSRLPGARLLRTRALPFSTLVG